MDLVERIVDHAVDKKGRLLVSFDDGNIVLYESTSPEVQTHVDSEIRRHNAVWEQGYRTHNADGSAREDQGPFQAANPDAPDLTAMILPMGEPFMYSLPSGAHLFATRNHLRTGFAVKDDLFLPEKLDITSDGANQIAAQAVVQAHDALKDATSIYDVKGRNILGAIGYTLSVPLFGIVSLVGLAISNKQNARVTGPMIASPLLALGQAQDAAKKQIKSISFNELPYATGEEPNLGITFNGYKDTIYTATMSLPDGTYLTWGKDQPLIVHTQGGDEFANAQHKLSVDHALTDSLRQATNGLVERAQIWNELKQNYTVHDHTQVVRHLGYAPQK